MVVPYLGAVGVAIPDGDIVATPFKVVAACNVYGDAGRDGDDDIAVEVVRITPVWASVVVYCSCGVQTTVYR